MCDMLRVTGCYNSEAYIHLSTVIEADGSLW